MYCSDSAMDDDSEQTAFRERRRYINSITITRNGKKHPRPGDLYKIINFKAILESCNRNDELPAGVFAVKSSFWTRVGLDFISFLSVLSVDEQCQWIRGEFSSFPPHPNWANNNALYGPIENSFDAAKENSLLWLEEILLLQCFFGEVMLYRWSKGMLLW